MPGHDTGYHDHDLSSGAVAVVEGRLVEERLVIGSAPRMSSSYDAGETFDFDAAHVHRMHQPGPGGVCLDPRLLAAALAHGLVRDRARRHAPAHVDLLRRGASARPGRIAEKGFANRLTGPEGAHG